MGVLIDIYLDLGEQQGFERDKGVTGKQLNNQEIEVSVALRRVTWLPAKKKKTCKPSQIL